MGDRLPPVVLPIVERLSENMQRCLGDSLVGLYVQGSLVVGDFDPFSDVDFIAVVSGELSEDQVADLNEMHSRLFNSGLEFSRRLEGSYFPVGLLSRPSKASELVWYLDNGSKSLERSDHCNTLVVRKTVCDTGVSVYGPSAKSLIPVVDTEDLKQEVRAVINDWGAELLVKSNWSNWYVSFTVNMFCRMLYTVESGKLNSKPEANSWAVENLDKCWESLIDSAWALRGQPEETTQVQASREIAKQTVEFVQMSMDRVNDLP